ncbi:MAG: hypothetical protein HZB50_17725 [Chloroflexi bacterium]|nr:hypothetical protein [Chloroflexota bacterium]
MKKAKKSLKVRKSVKALEVKNGETPKISNLLAMPDFKEIQASIYFSLASVIQGITIAVLGEKVFDFLPSMNIFIVITTISSLLISLHFWFGFLMAYFHLFRLVKLNAFHHFVLSLTYFLIGFSQVLAFQFLNRPKTWMTICVIMLVIVSMYQSFMRRILKMQTTEGVGYNVVSTEYGLFNRLIYLITVVVIILISMWYIYPNKNEGVFAISTLSVFLVLLLLLFIGSIRSFQNRLDKITFKQNAN